jgi:hypothetical protein
VALGEELHGALYIRYIDPYGAVMNGSATLVKATVLNYLIQIKEEIRFKYNVFVQNWMG